MDARCYEKLAYECLGRVSDWLEDFDPDELDFAIGDGIVTLEFADATRYVLNRQAAAEQVWYAAGARAWHYRWDEKTQRWLDDKDGHCLMSKIAETVGAKLGRKVERP